MYTQNEQAFSRPRSRFDIPALSVLALASIGASALRLAYALDAARAESSASNRGAPGRRRPSVPSAERSMHAESWRLK